MTSVGLTFSPTLAPSCLTIDGSCGFATTSMFSAWKFCVPLGLTRICCQSVVGAVPGVEAAHGATLTWLAWANSIDMPPASGAQATGTIRGLVRAQLVERVR